MRDGERFGLMTADGRRPRVAVVGGSHSASMVAVSLCEQFGCAPLAADTGEAVLAMLRSEHEVDLIVFDLAIPDMDGIVAAQLIRALGRKGSAPMIALTSDELPAASQRGRAAGFTAAVKKPYSPRELYGAMQSALNRAGLRVYS